VKVFCFHNKAKRFYKEFGEKLSSKLFDGQTNWQSGFSQPLSGISYSLSHSSLSHTTSHFGVTFSHSNQDLSGSQ